jgi:hypothetical protein
MMRSSFELGLLSSRGLPELAAHSPRRVAAAAVAGPQLDLDRA